MAVPQDGCAKTPSSSEAAKVNTTKMEPTGHGSDVPLQMTARLEFH